MTYTTRKRTHAALAALLIVTVSGCTVNKLSATIEPGVQLRDFHNYYVVHLQADARGINELIRDKLITIGYDATTGPATMLPEQTDVIVTYRDKWMWDITMYMLELTVKLRNAATSAPIATGRAYHTSLSRRSPQKMVDEVFGEIFASVASTR